MGTKLTSANPYLRDPKMRKRLVFISVASFSAIEGIHAPFKQPLTVDRPLPKSRAVKNKSSRLTAALYALFVHMAARPPKNLPQHSWRSNDLASITISAAINLPINHLMKMKYPRFLIARHRRIRMP